MKECFYTSIKLYDAFVPQNIYPVQIYLKLVILKKMCLLKAKIIGKLLNSHLNVHSGSDFIRLGVLFLNNVRLIWVMWKSLPLWKHD